MHHLELMTWFKTLIKINWMIVDFQSTDQKSTVYWKSQTWTFWSNSSAKDHNSSKYVKIWNLFIKKSRFHFEKSKFLNLEIFLSVENSCFFHNFRPNFHHDARWYKRNFQHESFIYPWNLQIFFTQLLLKMLLSQVIILWIHAHELKMT